MGNDMTTRIVQQENFAEADVMMTSAGKVYVRRAGGAAHWRYVGFGQQTFDELRRELVNEEGE